jgi:predicted dehydrogenase/nucleoside-diphosphate-sugar epimerase
LSTRGNMTLEDAGNTAAPLHGAQPLRLGIIGCGSITEFAHLPAAVSSSGVRVTALVDSDRSRMNRLLRKFGLAAKTSTNYRDILDQVDAVILAVPNHLHLPIGTELLSRRLHVLCEKPLAITRSECEQLCQAARDSSAILAVGYFTRFFPSTRLLKHLLESNFIGRVQSFDYEFGTEKGGWTPVSGYNLSRSTAGGGVLLVNGSHFFDKLTYWFDDLRIQRYADDNHGGVEANCRVELQARCQGSPITGLVTLSKTHILQNRLRVAGEYGSLELTEGEQAKITFFPKQSGLRQEISWVESSVEHEEYFRLQLDDFTAAILFGSKPMVTGEEASRSIALIEECYSKPEPLDLPWQSSTIASVVAPLKQGGATSVSSPLKRRVLITGASGLVGGRLSEVLSLVNLGWTPRALLRSTGSAAYLSRFDMDIQIADLRDRVAVDRAMSGCDAVIHLARGSRGVMFRGLKNVLDAAVKHNVSRFVHVSSIAVYGNNPLADSATEAVKDRKSGLDYGDEKLAQDLLVRKYARRHKLPVVILRPPNIWGPASHFSAGVITRIKNQAIPMVHASNPCNLVYVDNFVQATLLALTRSEAIGEMFFVTDDGEVSWKQCLDPYAAWLGTTIPRVSPASIKSRKPARLIRDSVSALPGVIFSREFRTTVRRIPLVQAVEAALSQRFESLSPAWQEKIRRRLSKHPATATPQSRSQNYDADDGLVAGQSRTVLHSNAKIKRLLGYTAPVSFSQGMQLTHAWLEYTGSIPHLPEPAVVAAVAPDKTV